MLTFKELRRRSGKTQQDVAAELLVNQSAVSLWETGKAIPCRKYRPQLAKLYGVSEAAIDAACKR